MKANDAEILAGMTEEQRALYERTRGEFLRASTQNTFLKDQVARQENEIARLRAAARVEVHVPAVTP